MGEVSQELQLAAILGSDRLSEKDEAVVRAAGQELDRRASEIAELTAEVERLKGDHDELRAVIERVAKRTRDGVWVTPGDQVWIATTRGARWFTLQHNWTVPLSVTCSRGPDAPDGWRDLGVEECFSTQAAAEAWLAEQSGPDTATSENDDSVKSEVTRKDDHAS